MRGCSMAAASDKKLQSFYAFNSGEYSKDLAGRTDLESFGSSTRYCCNFLSQVSGGLKKFYGTRHITEELVDNYHIKMIPFINKYEPMVLVVYGDEDATTDQGLKVGLIYGNSYKVLDITLPNTVVVNEMRWQQIQDKIIICHHSIQPIEILFYGKDEDNEYVFNVSQVQFKEIPYFPIGTTDDFQGELQANALTGEITLSIPSGSSDVRAYFPSVLLSSSSYTRNTGWVRSYSAEFKTDVTASTITLYRKRGGTSTALVSGTVNTTTKDKKVEHVSTGFGTNKYYVKLVDTILRERILQIIKTVCPSAYIDQTTIVLMGLTNHQNADEYYMTLSVGQVRHRDEYNNWVVDFTAQTLESVHYTPAEITTESINAEDLVGRKIKLYFNDDTQIDPWWQGKSVNAGDYAYSNGHFYKAQSTGTCGNIQPSHLVGIRSDGGVGWLYVHSGSNTGTVISVPSSSSIKIFVPEGEIPKNTNNIYKNYAWSIWGKDNVHPSQVYTVGNRLGFVCNTESYGAWNAMSVTDDYYNFSTEEYGEQLDTSAIVNLVANSESSQINWVLARNNLYMGGYSGEYFVSKNGQTKRTGVYTPTATMFDNISNMGGKAVVPLKYKELNMFVGMTGKELYTIAYDYTTDDYAPKSMGYLTQHIMNKGIKRMEALNNIDRNIYLLHDTNELSLFNYAAEQKVIGFTELNFGDEVVDFCATYAQEEVAAYVIVKRNSGNITIERFAITEPNYMFDEITQGDGTLADFQPMPHFANRTVYIRYGDNFSQFTKVTLDANGDISHDSLTGVYLPQAEYFKVGIPMVAEVHTQPAFGNKVEGHQQQSLSMYLRLVNSGAFEYGASVDFTKYFRHEYWNAQQEYGAMHRLFTGDMKLEIPLGYAEAQNQGEGPYPNTSAVGINIKSDTPEPLNILSIQEIYR